MVGEVVFGDEFVGNVGDFNFAIFVSFEWCLKVEVADVEGGKPGAGAGQDAVEDKFREFE